MSHILRSGLMAVSALALLAPLSIAKPKAPKPSPDLRIISVDVEGGAAVLFRTPEGKSMLIDTGWTPGAGNPAPIKGAPPATTWRRRCG